MTTKKIKGFTIVELLISLAITAMIMTSVAFALNASFDNYGENKKMYQAVNNARQALTRITNELRTSKKVYIDGETEEQCSMQNANGDLIRYQYNEDSNSVCLITTDGTYLLCDNVSDMQFIKNEPNKLGFAKKVVISMTVKAGDVNKTLSAAAIIRRAFD